MSTTRTETGTIDLKAQKAANDNASKTATDYITAVSNDGIWVTPSDGKPANGTAIARTTGWHISDALEYFRKGFSHFRLWMDTTLDKMKMRLGQDTSGHVVIDDDGVEVFSDGYTSSAYFGSETRVGREVGSHIELSQDGLDYKFGSSSLFAIEAVSDASYTIIGTALWSQAFNLSAMSAQAIASEEVTTHDEITVSLSGCTSSRPDARLLYLVNGEYVPVPLYTTGESVPSGTTVYAMDFGTIDLCEYSDELIEYVKTGEYGYVFRLYLSSGSQALSTTVALAFAEPSVDSVAARIGQSTESHMEQDYHSLKLIAKEGDEYFYVSDLRDVSGMAEIREHFVGNGTTSVFSPQFVPAADPLPSATVNGTEAVVSSVVGIPQPKITLESVPPNNASVVITYMSASPYLKAFTFGTRRSNSFVGGLSSSSGFNNTASGAYSFAEGYHTNAIGKDSHAEGSYTTASGWYSHAECDDTLASGWSSHAEGSSTTASELSSHAEGMSTTASGVSSHAEGSYTTAAGISSHAEGYDARAAGFYSHAQNEGTYTGRYAQTAIGTYNVKDWEDLNAPEPAPPTTHPNGNDYYGQYALIVGNGTSDNARSNALAVEWDGRVNQWASNIDMTTAPSSAVYDRMVEVFDKNGDPIGWFQVSMGTDGGHAVCIGASNSDDSAQNQIQLGYDVNGNPTAWASEPAKLRNALGASSSGIWPVALGGSGQSGVTTITNAVSGVSGVSTISAQNIKVWGKVAQLSVQIKLAAALSVPANGNCTDTTVANISTDYRPALLRVVSATSGAYRVIAHVNATGTIVIAQGNRTGSAYDIPKDTQFYITATYLIP